MPLGPAGSRTPVPPDPRGAFYARLECRDLVGDGRAVDARLEPSEKCAVLRAGDPHGRRSNRRQLAGRSRMARPGLEPGTPRFSVVRSSLSNDAENAANSRLRRGQAHVCKLRKFHGFLADSGDEGRLVSQSGTRLTSSGPVAATLAGSAGLWSGRSRVRKDASFRERIASERRGAWLGGVGRGG